MLRNRDMNIEAERIDEEDLSNNSSDETEKIIKMMKYSKFIAFNLKTF